MAKTIDILIPDGSVESWTEGTADVIKIVTTAHWNQPIQIKIYFGSSPTLEYWTTNAKLSN